MADRTQSTGSVSPLRGLGPAPPSEAPSWATSAPDLALDFETFYSAGYSVKDLGYAAYVSDSRFEAILAAMSDGENAIAVEPRRFPWAVLHGKSLVAHNAAFDAAVFRRLQETGVIPAEVQPACWHDTAALCAYIGAPRALEEAAAAMLGLTLDKSVRDRLRGGPDLFDDLNAYAAQDARAAARLWHKFRQYWPEQEQRIAALTVEMESRGILMDWEKVDVVRQSLEGQAEATRRALPWYPRRAATSLKALAAECARHRVPPPETTDVKEEAFAEWLARYGGTEPGRCVRLIQDIRSLNRAAKVLAAMRARKRPDGRIDAHTRYFGASTGRWSGGKHGLNLQNLNKGDPGDADIRGCLVAPEGRRLARVDLSQIEPRCLAWVAGDRAWLDLVRSGANPYEAHAVTAHGWTGKKLKAESPRLYALCKAERLGLGYGCGAEKFVAVARTLGGIEVSLEESRKIVSAFRGGNPAITALWQRLERAFVARHGKDYRLPLPSGRKLRYFGVDADAMTAAVVRGGPALNFYGGKLCENMIQAMARDVFAEGLLRVEAAGLNPILTVHDEVVCEVPEADAEAALREAIRLMTVPPAWAPDLPLEAEGAISKAYTK